MITSIAIRPVTIAGSLAKELGTADSGRAPDTTWVASLCRSLPVERSTDDSRPNETHLIRIEFSGRCHHPAQVNRTGFGIVPRGVLASPLGLYRNRASMLETSNAGTPLRVGLVSTFPPIRCGIGRFAASLVDALAAVDPTLDIEVIRLKCGQNAHLPGATF